MIPLVLLDANPIIAIGGQVAAIILCVFLLISVLLMLAVNLGLAFLLAWIREKANAIKLLRPTVDSVNKSSEAALQGQPIDSSGNELARTVASLPASIHSAEQKVEQISDKVVDATIEFRARIAQAQAIVKAFLAPGSNRQKALQPGNGSMLPAPGTESSKKVAEQTTPEADKATHPASSRPVTTASEGQHVSTR